MRFNEENHSYINEDGVLYTSATSFIKRFCKPFEKMKIATKYAKKHKKTVEEVLADWDKAGKDAIHKGLLFHKMKEEDLLSKTSILIEGEEHTIYPSEYDGLDKISDKQVLEPGIYPELCVWSDKYEIAGQADYVEITKSKKINIRDYKTSKEIKKESFRAWDGTVQRMSFPLHHLEDSNFWHYSLQLNLYAFLIKQHNRGFKIGKMVIDHVIADIQEDGTFQNVRIDEHEVPDLQKEVKIALEFYKNQRDESINRK